MSNEEKKIKKLNRDDFEDIRVKYDLTNKEVEELIELVFQFSVLTYKIYKNGTTRF